jgi:hypothetical protein
VFSVAVLFYYLANGDRALSDARAAASSSAGRPATPQQRGFGEPLRRP